MQLDKNLYEEINEYCKLNGLKTRDFIHEVLKEAFLIKKYGSTPFAFKHVEKKDKQINSIVIKDKIVEEENLNDVNGDISKVFDEELECKVAPINTTVTPIEKNIPDLIQSKEDIKPKKKRRLS